MPTRVFLLRHAESADPTVFHGAESDIELSDRGRQQAEVTAHVLAKHRPDVVISSGMRRALQTAQPIAELCGAPLLVEPHLHERRVSILSGMPFPAHDNIWPETVKRWSSGDTGFAHEGAESFDDLRARILPVWQRLITTHRNRQFVVVAHGIVCKVLLLSILPGHSHADWQRLGPIRNVAISELEETPAGWNAVVLNQQAEALASLGLA